MNKMKLLPMFEEFIINLECHKEGSKIEIKSDNCWDMKGNNLKGNKGTITKVNLDALVRPYEVTLDDFSKIDLAYDDMKIINKAN
jgi:hypothetical protein